MDFYVAGNEVALFLWNSGRTENLRKGKRSSWPGKVKTEGKRQDSTGDWTNREPWWGVCSRFRVLGPTSQGTSLCKLPCSADCVPWEVEVCFEDWDKTCFAFLSKHCIKGSALAPFVAICVCSHWLRSTVWGRQASRSVLRDISVRT